MAPFIDKDRYFLHVNTLVFDDSSANVENPAVIPNFFCKKWKTFVMYWWFVHFMFWNSVLGVTARTSFLVPIDTSSQRECSCCCSECPLLFQCDFRRGSWGWEVFEQYSISVFRDYSVDAICWHRNVYDDCMWLRWSQLQSSILCSG